MSIFGNGVQHEEFPTWDGTGTSKLWINAREDDAFGEFPEVIAHVSMRNFGRENDPSAGLTREQAKDAIEALQRILDEAGAEPFDVSKVEVGHVLSNHDARELPLGSLLHCGINGRTYERDEDGLWTPSEWEASGGVYLSPYDSTTLRVDRIGPEPIVEPECDFLVDPSGDYWVKNASGHWTYGSTLRLARQRAEDGAGELPFAHLVRLWAPLTPYRTEHVALDVIPVPA